MEMSIRVDWRAEREVPARPSNVVLVQGAGEELFLSFGHIAPPIEVALMNEEADGPIPRGASGGR